MSLFIGKKEVIGVTELKDTTPLGGKILEVTYVDNTKEVLTEKTFNNSVTNQEVDLNELRDFRTLPVVKEILVLFREANLKMDEIDYVSQVLIESINRNNEAAQNKLWGVQYSGDVTFIMQDNVLKDGSEDATK